MTRGGREVGHGGFIYPDFDDPVPEPRPVSEDEARVFQALGFSEVAALRPRLTQTDANESPLLAASDDDGSEQEKGR